MLRKVAFVFCLLSITLFSCDEKPPFPRIHVDFTLNLHDPEYRDLLGVGSTITVVGGSRGIIIKRTDLNEFKAFDQHCSHDPEDPNAKVSLEEGGVDFVICETCKTKYNLYYGNVEDGPGKRSLVEYKATFYPNANRLRISN